MRSTTPVSATGSDRERRPMPSAPLRAPGVIGHHVPYYVPYYYGLHRRGRQVPQAVRARQKAPPLSQRQDHVMERARGIETCLARHGGSLPPAKRVSALVNEGNNVPHYGP